MEKLLEDSTSAVTGFQRNSRHANSIDPALVNLLEDIENENDWKFMIFDIEENLSRL